MDGWTAREKVPARWLSTWRAYRTLVWRPFSHDGRVMHSAAEFYRTPTGRATSGDRHEGAHPQAKTLAQDHSVVRARDDSGHVPHPPRRGTAAQSASDRSPDHARAAARSGGPAAREDLDAE